METVQIETRVPYVYYLNYTSTRIRSMASSSQDSASSSPRPKRNIGEILDELLELMPASAKAFSERSNNDLNLEVDDTGLDEIPPGSLPTMSSLPKLPPLVPVAEEPPKKRKRYRQTIIEISNDMVNYGNGRSKNTKSATSVRGNAHTQKEE